MKTRTLADYEFAEIVDWQAGAILKGLIAGDFRTSVWTALDLAMRWQAEKAKAEPLKKQRKWGKQ